MDSQLWYSEILHDSKKDRTRGAMAYDSQEYYIQQVRPETKQYTLYDSINMTLS